MSDDITRPKSSTVSTTSGNKNSNIWYIRKNDKITGPFPSGQLSQLLVVGRLNVDDEISHDKDEWLKIQEVPSLIPDVLTDDSDESQAERLAAARRWADERREERRLENPQTPSRVSNGRRNKESEQDVEYRQHRESVYKQFRERPKTAITKLVTYTTFIFALIWASFNYSPLTISDEPDCSTSARKGVNWRLCNKLGLVAIRADFSESNLNSTILRNSNLFASVFTQSRMDYSDLSGSNLSYAVFNKANLKGANLKNSDLRQSDFTSANLSYVDFSNSSIVGANFKNADLSHAIWIDGGKCKSGSIGLCVK